jgi:hypothetical protein
MHVRTGTAAAGGRAAAGPPSQPVIAHQPAEPSAMARASITRICVSGSNSGPVQARGIAMPKTPASFIAAIDCGIRRPVSISSLAARICSAGPIAACRVGESSAAVVPAAWAIDKDLPDRVAGELDSSEAKLSRLDVRGADAPPKEIRKAEFRIYWNSAKREQCLGRFGGAIDRQCCR